MRRKLYSSRRVKEEGTIYIPKKKYEQYEQQAAIVYLMNPELLRVKALIKKYQII
jgi:tRNA 2-selenouridine synthase SelU